MAGSAFGALHMTWGAVNEWTTQAGYARLIDRAQHPVLTDLLNRIMRQEGNHIAFYAGEAADRLAGHPAGPAGGAVGAAAPVAARRRRRHAPGEVAFMVQTLFGDQPGHAIAARIDRRIDRLPGLADLGLVSGAIGRYAGPVAGIGPGGPTASAA